jgi:RNA-binding protein YlmH
MADGFKNALMARFASLPGLAGSADERLLFSRLADQVCLCSKNGRRTFTRFLDPARARIFAEIIEKTGSGVAVAVFGGSDGAERVMLGFGPDGYAPERSEFPIDALGAVYSKLASAPRHGDILGAVVGLGVDRAEIGDIIQTDGRIVVFLSRKVSEFVAANLEKAGRVPLKTEILAAPPESEGAFAGERVCIPVASPRLDAVISAAFKLPRSKSAELAASGRVFVNWREETSPAREVKPGDMVTARGYGRLLLERFAGESRKGRIYLDIVVWRR